MKKINVILHETTIINFPFFWKLIKRYAVISVIAPLVAIMIGGYVYYSQKDIYLKSASFKYQVDNGDSTGNLASVLGDKNQGLTVNEVRGIMGTYDFAKQVAVALSKRDDLLDLNFTPINRKQFISTKDYLMPCGPNKECIIKKLQALAPYLYTMEVDRLIENRFWVRIKSLDKKTTDVLTKIVVEELGINRVNTIKHSISEQIKLSEELIDKKKEELTGFDMLKVRDEHKEILSQIAELEKKIGSFNSLYHSQKVKLTLAETRYNQTKTTIKKRKVKQEDVETYKKRVELTEKIKKTQGDINAIKLSANTLSNQDKIIIAQLNSEIKAAKEQLSKLGSAGRSISNIVTFLDKKDKESDFNEFDYKVLKNQFQKIESDYKGMLKEKEDLEAKARGLANTLEKHKPSFEYIKLLKEKIVQMRLLESTVVSDFVFDKENGGISRFKRTSRSKIILFSMTTAIFLLFLIVLIRYISDDRIYDTYELEKSFEELTIIGNTPDFD